MIHNLFRFLAIVLLSVNALAQIKQTKADNNDITLIKTSIGIATIIELSEPIQAAIIGDQSSFKIEALDKAVTIKPLYSHAKSNLFLITAKRRYSFKLQAMSVDQADYIVRVKDENESGQSRIKWVNVLTSQKSESFYLKDIKVTSSKEGYFILQGKIYPPSGKGVYKLKSEDFWVKQNKSSVEIQTLYLSGEALDKTPVKFALAVFKSDLKSQGLSLEIKDKNAKNPLVVNLSRGLVWN